MKNVSPDSNNIRSQSSARSSSVASSTTIVSSPKFNKNSTRQDPVPFEKKIPNSTSNYLQAQAKELQGNLTFEKLQSNCQNKIQNPLSPSNLTNPNSQVAKRVSIQNNSRGRSYTRTRSDFELGKSSERHNNDADKMMKDYHRSLRRRSNSNIRVNSGRGCLVF